MRAFRASEPTVGHGSAGSSAGFVPVGITPSEEQGRLTGTPDRSGPWAAGWWCHTSGTRNGAGSHESSRVARRYSRFHSVSLQVINHEHFVLGGGENRDSTT